MTWHRVVGASSDRWPSCHLLSCRKETERLAREQEQLKAAFESEAMGKKAKAAQEAENMRKLAEEAYVKVRSVIPQCRSHDVHRWEFIFLAAPFFPPITAPLPASVVLCAFLPVPVPRRSPGSNSVLLLGSMMRNSRPESVQGGLPMTELSCVQAEELHCLQRCPITHQIFTRKILNQDRSASTAAAMGEAGR